MERGRKDALRVDLERRRITLEQDGRTDEWSIEQVRKASKAYGRAWSVVFLDAARALASLKLSPLASRALWWCIGSLHPRDWTICKHDRLAEALGCSRVSATRALGELQQAGLIQAGENSSLRLTLYLGWQGTAGAYQQARRGRQKEIDRAREHLRGLGADDQPPGLMRVVADGEDLGPRERTRAQRRGGVARPIGALIGSAEPKPKAVRGIGREVVSDMDAFLAETEARMFGRKK